MTDICEKIITEFLLQNNLHQKNLSDSNIAFAVFSCEPFGFEFPCKAELKKTSPRTLSKKNYLMNEAKESLDDLLNNSSELIFMRFFENRELTQQKFFPWLRIVIDSNELESIIDDFMPGYNIGWEWRSVSKNKFIVLVIYLWIQLESEGTSAYKRIYRV